jgi:hypothetical protein
MYEIAAPLAKLLIVDDERAQMTALCDTLEHEGYLTTGFTSAKEALATLRGQKFDLLLTDLMMPEMDGITLLRAAQQVDHNLVGIVMTGHGTVDTAVDAMKVGAIDYILKPFKLSTILPVLARALSVRWLRMENEELQQRVREHTAALEVANKELQAANKELEAFSYTVSHDLRAPLRAIDGFSQILSKDHAPQLSAEAQTLLEAVSANARRMGQLIDDLLAFSRLGHLPVSKERVNVAGLVQKILDEMRREHEGRDVEVRVDPLPDCMGDPSLLKQVWVNLLSNAFKFTRQRERALIEISCHEQQGEKVYVVRDNGAGFDMTYFDKLFGVFQRLHRSDEFEGTGAGLAIVQRIIHRHGGRIRAEAAVNQGAAFFFTLSP